MQITITGPRSGGSTILAAELLHHLGGVCKQHVTLVCSQEQQRLIREVSSYPSRGLTHTAHISIVVDQEREDEMAVKMRKENP